MATKKTTATAAKVETKKVEAPVKAVEAEVKETVKVEEVKAEPVKKAPAKKAEPKKEAVKKETVKKEAAPKKAPAKKAVNASVMVEFNGQSISTEIVVENVKKAFEAEGNKLSAIKDLQIYVKPEDNAAYYVINQDITGKINLF